MIDFWIAAIPLLLAAAACLLVPLWRAAPASRIEAGRTATNVALYQERLAELSAQKEAGVLSAPQWEQAQAELARELLVDTETESVIPRSRTLGRGLPALIALCVPVVAVYLYWHWGSQAKLELAREIATPPASVEEMVSRLERTVHLQPEAGQAWYVLGRTYMTQNRPADAAKAFEQALSLLGRSPELIGQLIQARYFGMPSSVRRWTPALQHLADEALQGNPQEATTLGLLGVAAYEEKRFQDAVRFWEQLIAQLPASDPSRSAIEGGVARAKAELARQQVANTPATPVPSATPLKLSLSLDPALLAQVNPEDTVFVFARAEVALPMPMPLAVKRLKVADLPAHVTLSDADAMLPQLRLSAFEQVSVSARISRAGNARQGEWKAAPQSLKLKGLTEAVSLVIDRPDSASE